MTTATGTPWCRAARRKPSATTGAARDFPWGLVILGGIGYIAWRKGAFDRFGGPGGPFGNGGHYGQRGMQRYGTGNDPAQTPGQQRPAMGVARSSAGRARSSRSGTGRRTRRPAASQYPAPPAPPSAPGRGSGVRSWRRAGRVRPDPAADPAGARVLGIDGWRGRCGR